MKMLLITTLIGLIAIVGTQAIAMTSTLGYQNEIVEHGGGCRKSSPPGQCCHMNRKTGVVHCH